MSNSGPGKQMPYNDLLLLKQLTSVTHCSVASVNHLLSFSPGMNAAVRAVVRMGLYVGAKVYFIHEVSHILH